MRSIVSPKLVVCVIFYHRVVVPRLTLLINLAHDPLRPLKSSNDHAPSSRAISRVEAVFCCLQVTSHQYASDDAKHLSEVRGSRMASGFRP